MEPRGRANEERKRGNPRLLLTLNHDDVVSELGLDRRVRVDGLVDGGLG